MTRPSRSPLRRRKQVCESCGCWRYSVSRVGEGRLLCRGCLEQGRRAS